MNHKLKLSNYFYILILSFFTLIEEAKSFPNSFHSEYHLYQKQNFLGNVIVNFKKENNEYEIKALTKAQGIMKILGDSEIISKGKINLKGFSPQKFKLKNKKKPKKNILAIFNLKEKKIQINYKQQISSYLLKNNHLDILSYLYQFNFESLDKKKYNFNIVDGKRSRTYVYKKIRQEFIKTGIGNLEADVYEGEIIEKDNSKHLLWILRKPYRIPLQIEIKTKIGININQVLVETNLF
tara:strand:+ start:960 stop:1673 length:714 start_codon:yes stop_codon:yes gene_type:complete